MLCPRCRSDQPEGPEECAACGVVFAKYRPRPGAFAAGAGPGAFAAGAGPGAFVAGAGAPAGATPAVPLRRGPGLAWLWARMFQVSPAEHRAGVAARAVLLAGLGLWGIRLLFLPYQGEALGDSFLHWIYLPFHEAGHVVFQPFGSFLHILGGTLGQLLVPLLVIGAFLREANLNPFGAAVATGWLGTSFMDCAPYINDARERGLMLLSGVTGQEDFEGHDWYQLLSRTGCLQYDHALARCSWTLGVVLMLAALAWGAFVLWRQARPGAAEAA